MDALEYREGWRIAWRAMRVARSGWMNDQARFGRLRGNLCIIKWVDCLTVGLMDQLHLEQPVKRELFLKAFIHHGQHTKKPCALAPAKFHHHLAVRRNLTAMSKYPPPPVGVIGTRRVRDGLQAGT